MKIRTAKCSDEESLKKIYASARDYMAKEGNPTQWGKNHPTIEKILNDIKEECLLVMEDDKKKVHAAFALQPFDLSYDDKNCAWKDTSPYLVIHSLASDGVIKGVFDKALTYAYSKCEHIRIDTHKDNKTMLRHIKDSGFVEAGFCHEPDGTIRLCFELVS